MTLERGRDTLVCDYCRERTDSEVVPRWVRVGRYGVASTFGDALYEDKEFCSVQHAALWLLRLADQTEILGHEAMMALGRHTSKSGEQK